MTVTFVLPAIFTTSIYKMDFLTIIDETEQEFIGIAQTLFDSYAIQTHDVLYRMLEIEFYWNSPNHVDTATYIRKHIDPKSGDWFFHYSGVDIALRNMKTGGYGGILIRSLFDTTRKTIVKGPMVCAMKLFSGTNAFQQSIKTQIVPYTFDKSNLQQRPRIGLSEQKNNSHKLNYAFFINPAK